MTHPRTVTAIVASVAAVVLFGAAGWQTHGSASGAAIAAATLTAQSPALVSSPGAVALTWSSVSPAPASWNVLRSADLGGPWTRLATLPGGATTYSDTTATGAAYYEVRPVLERWIGDSLAAGTSQSAVGPEAAVAVSDDFAPREGSTALGTAAGWALGGDLTWQTPGSNTTDWSRSAGGRATVSSAATDPIATVDAGTPDVAVTEHVLTPGDAVYLRVQDAGDWLRARVDAVKKHVDGGYEAYTTQYQWKQPDQVFDIYEQDIYRWTVIIAVYKACNPRNTSDCIYTTNPRGDATHTYVISKQWVTSGAFGTTPEYYEVTDHDCTTPPVSYPPLTDCELISSTTSEVPHGQQTLANDRFLGTTTVAGSTYWWDDPNAGAAAADVRTGLTQQVAQGWVDTSYDEEDYSVVLDRDTGATVSTLATYALGTTLPNSLRVAAIGTQVSVATGSAPLGALQVDGLGEDTHCGVGLAPTTDAAAAGSPRIVGGVTIDPAV